MIAPQARPVHVPGRLASVDEVDAWRAGWQAGQRYATELSRERSLLGRLRRLLHR